jgi:hypothetical protein
MEQPLPAMLSCFGKLLRARELFGQVMNSTARFREGDLYRAETRRMPLTSGFADRGQAAR